MKKKYYSIVDLGTGEKFGNYDSIEQAKGKALYYATTFRSKVAIIDDDNNVIIGYSQIGKEIKKDN